jgi:hypothetical protein
MLGPIRQGLAYWMAIVYTGQQKQMKWRYVTMPRVGSKYKA